MQIKKPFLPFAAAIMLACFAAFPASGMEQNGKKTTARYSDTWLKAKLLTTYTLNKYLNPFDIHVEVNNGVVTLSGKVDSGVEKDLAVEIAKGTAGVKEVHDELVIQSDAKTPPKEKTDFSQMVKDATITAMVKSRLLWNRNIEALHIDVDTNRGVVVLSGRIESAIKRDLAVQIAKNTSGVKKVVDKLQVTATNKRPDTSRGSGERIKNEVSDAWITGKVKAVLIASKDAEGTDIDVTTRNKVVTLSGSVKNREQEEKVIALVADVIGVADVKSNLTIGEK
ncbi:MAG: BON domain-containing protein [Deltaproteobacteria bacterium]